MTTAELATFLGKWSGGKPISHYMSGTRFYRCGKWMTQLEQKDVKRLLKQGIATGTVEQFTVPGIKKTAAERRAERET